MNKSKVYYTKDITPSSFALAVINDDVTRLTKVPGVGKKTAKDLARLEGIMCGISSGTNVAAALKLAKKLGKGKTVVTVLPDTAERYFSTPLFDGE